jgi:hypothetical protein
MKKGLALATLLALFAFSVGCGGGSSAKTETQGQAPIGKGGKPTEGLQAPAQPKAFD